MARTVYLAFLQHHETLETAIYNPDRTKGGLLARPLYCKGDRGPRISTAEKYLVSSELNSAPVEYGWITPTSRHC